MAFQASHTLHSQRNQQRTGGYTTHPPTKDRNSNNEAGVRISLKSHPKLFLLDFCRWTFIYSYPKLQSIIQVPSAYFRFVRFFLFMRTDPENNFLESENSYKTVLYYLEVYNCKKALTQP